MKLVERFVALNLVEEKDTDLYEYSINILRGYIFFVILVFIGNIFTMNLVETIVFLFLFFNLRRFCGGVHLQNSFFCLILSTLIVLIIPEFSKQLSISYEFGIFLQLLFSIFIYFIPTIETPTS